MLSKLSPLVRLVLVLLLLLIGLACFTPAAHGWSGGANGPSPCCSGSGGGGSAGPVTYWELENTDATLKPINNLFDTSTYQGTPLDTAGVGELKVRSAFLKNCNFAAAPNGDNDPSDRPVSGSNCPLIWAKEESGSTATVNNNDYIHYHDPLNEYLRGSFDISSKSIVAFNVKIWRFDGRSDQATPIFQRRVGVTPAAATESGSGSPRNEFYYFMGLPEAPAATGDESTYDTPTGEGPWECQADGYGGSWGNGACPNAGPLTIPSNNGPDYDKSLCNQAQNSAGNDTRQDSEGDTITDTTKMNAAYWTIPQQTAVRPVINKKPISTIWDSNGQNYAGNDSGTCYWEGAQIGPDYWQGENGYGPNKADSKTDAEGTNPNNTPQDQFGKDGTIDKGLEEAIRLTWSIPSGTGGAIPSIHYYIIGPPDVWYAIQIVATDQRQQIIPLSTSSYVDAASGYNYFRVFQAGQSAPVPPSKVCTKPPVGSCPSTPCESEDPSQICFPSIPTPTSTPSTPSPTTTTPTTTTPPSPQETPRPTLLTQLATPAAASVLNTTQQAIDVEPNDDLAAGQAIFSTSITLNHFTPQGQYDGALTNNLADVNASTGPDAYVQYPNYTFPLAYRNVQVPADWQLMPTGTGGTDPVLGMASMPLAAAVLNPQTATVPSGASLTDPPYSVGVWQTQWLRPTLNNPCFDTEPTEATSPWPTNRRVCQGGTGAVQDATAVRNAWDDYFSAATEWEARWLGDANIPAADQNDSSRFAQLLRCDDQNTTAEDDDACGDQWQELRWFGRPQTQVADGFINVTADPTDTNPDTNDSGYARIVLKTNYPDYVTAAAVWQRETGNIQGRNTSASPEQEDSNTTQVQTNGVFTNTRTFQPEMDFCRQGVHPNSYIYQAINVATGTVSSPNPSSPDPTKDYHVTASDSMTGDQDCRGFDVQWQWDTDDSSCDVSAQPLAQSGLTDAISTAKTPPASSFPAPTALFGITNTNPAAPNYNDLTAASNDTHTTDNTLTSYVADNWGVWGEEPGTYADGSKAYYTGTNTADAQATGLTKAWSPDTDLRNALGAAASNAYRPPYAAIDNAAGAVNPGEGRPGNGYAEQKCSRTVAGVWKTGHWQQFWAFTTTPNACVLYNDYDTHTGAPIAPGNEVAAAEAQRPADATDSESDPANGVPPAPTYCPGSSTTTTYTVPYASASTGGTNFTHCDTSEYFLSFTKGPCYESRINLGTQRHPDYVYENGTAQTWSHRSETEAAYSFGYWHYEYIWYWGQTQSQYANGTPANPNNCYSKTAGDTDPDIPASQNGNMHLSDTQAANNYRYAGPLTPHDDYGRTDFVWAHAGPNRSTDPTYGPLESEYKADVTNGEILYANGTSANGFWGNSWSCSVTRTNGYRISGVWTLDQDTGTPASSPNGANRSQYAAMDDHGYAYANQVWWADAGWGKNNTGPRLSADDYTVQFSFNPNIPESVLPAGGSNIGLCNGNDHNTPANTTLASDPNDPAVTGGDQAVCWRLSATYQGNSYWDWQTASGHNNPDTDPGSQQVVKVYEARDNR